MSKYLQATEYLFGLQRVGIKLGLKNIQILLNSLGNPQTRWPAIHIAGTNGKGSTGAMLESILMCAGYKVGLYTSPHLVDFVERIRINREPIAEDVIVNFVEKLRPVIEDIDPSFFEVTTALAFQYFADKSIDIAIIETGMGGRLDSTNILTPLISVISQIDYDHQNYLGDTIEDIAGEKAGIIKPNITCVTSNRNKTIIKTISDACQKKEAELFKVFDHYNYQIQKMELTGTEFKLTIDGKKVENLYVNLPGEYQLINVLLAVGTVSQLAAKMKISREAIVNGLKSIFWNGRCQLISTNPHIIIDVSHNFGGFKNTLAFIRKFFTKEQLNVITFLQEDKDYRRIGDLLIENSERIFIINLIAGKPLNPQTFSEYIISKGGKVQVLDSLASAMYQIKESRKDCVWLIIGSHHLAGEAYKHFNGQWKITKEMAVGHLT